MIRYLSDLDAEFVDTQIAVERLEAIGPSRVFFRGRVTARGRASGINLDVPIWALWEVHEGKVLRGTAFLNEADALEAVGLREQIPRGQQDAAAAQRRLIRLRGRFTTPRARLAAPDARLPASSDPGNAAGIGRNPASLAATPRHPPAAHAGSVKQPLSRREASSCTHEEAAKH